MARLISELPSLFESSSSTLTASGLLQACVPSGLVNMKLPATRPFAVAAWMMVSKLVTFGAEGTDDIECHP